MIIQAFEFSYTIYFAQKIFSYGAMYEGVKAYEIKYKRDLC